MGAPAALEVRLPGRLWTARCASPTRSLRLHPLRAQPETDGGFKDPRGREYGRAFEVDPEPPVHEAVGPRTIEWPGSDKTPTRELGRAPSFFKPALQAASTTRDTRRCRPLRTERWGDPMAAHGENRWPPVGTFSGRLWGDSHGGRPRRSLMRSCHSSSPARFAKDGSWET